MSFSIRRSVNKIRPVAFALIGYICLVLFISKEQHALNDQIAKTLVRVRALQGEQVKLSEMQESLAVDVNKTSHSIHALDAQMEQLVQNTKRYNLIFRGINANEGEDAAELVRDLVEKSMGIELGEKDVEYAYRMKTNGTDPRPILAKFARWKDKTRVLYRRKSLPPDIAVVEDLTKTQMLKRRKLVDYAAAAESEGRKVKWSGKTLFVDGKEVKADNI